MMNFNYGSSSTANNSGLIGGGSSSSTNPGFSQQNSQRQGDKPGFFQGIDFDEVTGVNAFPFKLNASFCFTSSGGQQGQEFVVSTYMH
jgi:hypothetical protein